MAAKKKTKSKKKHTATARGKKKTLAKAKKTAAKGRVLKKSAKKKAQTKGPVKRKVIARTTAARTRSTPAKQVLKKRPGRVAASPGLSRGTLSGEQSGDLQGLSRNEGADSESVTELLEEGNAFEADVVTGVEDADDTEEREVRTHEVPEDDVPEEYREKD